MATMLAPENVVGRDTLIRDIWHLMKRHSVVFTAERRIGKTTVMRKMQAEAPSGIIATYLDLEKVDSPHRFVEVLLEEVNNLLPKTEKARNVFKGLMEAVGGTEIAGIVKIPELEKRSWQPALEKTLASICENQRDSTLVFLFDELPYMLQKIAVQERNKKSKDDAALAILDSLRAMRTEHDNLRMVFAGSIGLHHVIHSLRGADYASQPLNDMTTIEIGPLDEPDALELAKQLLIEEKVDCDCQNDIATELITLADRVPFYIERVIMRLALTNSRVTTDILRQHVQDHLVSDSDYWEMEHFRTRIPISYPGTLVNNDRNPISEEAVVTAILDFLAMETIPQSINQIKSAIKASLPVEDQKIVIQLLRNLYQDHYLISDNQKRYSFRFPLIKKWWVLAQGLPS